MYLQIPYPTRLVGATNKPIPNWKAKREKISFLTRLWLGWWWDSLFLHLLSPFLPNITTNRVGQVDYFFQDLSWKSVKVQPGKEETPAHSRHPLPPIFLSPTSSRYLKVIIVMGRECLFSENFQEIRMETAVSQWKKRAAMSRLEVKLIIRRKKTGSSWPIEKEKIEILQLRSPHWLPGSIMQQKKMVIPTTTWLTPNVEELLVNIAYDPILPSAGLFHLIQSQPFHLSLLHLFNPLQLNLFQPLMSQSFHRILLHCILSKHYW